MARIDEEFRRPAGADPFDVLCVGDATMTFVPSVPARPSPFGDVTESFREGGGATRAAMALGRRDAKVGLVTTLRDDRAGRHLVDDLRHACVDTRAVRLAVPEKSLLFVTGTGGARQVASLGEDVDPVVVPPGWSTKVLLLSGLSPSTGYAASLCAAARSARKRGTIVVLDVNARRSRWAGHDVRRTNMIFREVDVVRCSATDLAALGTAPDDLRKRLRPGAVFVESRPLGAAAASGPFGDLVRAPASARDVARGRSGDVLSAVLALALARAPGDPLARPEFWDDALGAMVGDDP